LANFEASPDCRRHNCLHWLQRQCTENSKKYSQNRNCAVSVPIFTFICLWASYIFPRLVCLFCCRKICGPILGEYINRSQTHECDVEIRTEATQFLFLGIHKWEFRCSVFSFYLLYFLFAPNPEIVTLDFTFMKLIRCWRKTIFCGRSYNTKRFDFHIWAYLKGRWRSKNGLRKAVTKIKSTVVHSSADGLYIHLYYTKITRVSAPSSVLAPPDPSPAGECVPPFGTKGGRATLACGWGGGGSQFDTILCDVIVCT
jgi:hypothetical protein